METQTHAAHRAGPDRFLIGILVGIGALLLIAAASVFVLRQPAALLPPDTPAGVTQRFFIALEQRDYLAAYDYFHAGMAEKPGRDEFVRFHADQEGFERPQRRIRIQDEEIAADTATVTLSITEFYNAGGLFGSESTFMESFTLGRQDGTWRITGLPFQYRPFPSR